MSKYRAIDADGHFTEPAGIWPQYLAKKYHPMAPRGVRDNTGRRRIMIGGRMLPYIPGRRFRRANRRARAALIRRHVWPTWTPKASRR